MDSFHARNHRTKARRPAVEQAQRSTPRADQRLVAQGLAGSRSAAQALIATGRVRWRDRQGEHQVKKAADTIPPQARLCLADDDPALPPLVGAAKL